MKSNLARSLMLILTVLLFVSSASAGWRFYSYDARTDIKTDGSVNPTKHVQYYVDQYRYMSYFTIYKPNVSGMRVYITVWGASYWAFEQYMLFGKSTSTVYTKPDGTDIVYGGIDMSDAALSAGGDEVKITMYMSDEFKKLYGHNPQVGVWVIGQPGQVAGYQPDVTVDIDNAHIRFIKVDYPRPQIRIDGEVGNTNLNFVGGGAKVKGITELDMPYGIGGIIVRGGFIEDSTSQTGFGQLVSRGRRVKKTLIAGGSCHGAIVTRGKIGRIFMSNGLGSPAGTGVPSAKVPKIATGYNSVTKVRYPRGIRKIILKRGGLNAIVAAGEDTGSSTWMPIGSIGKLVVNLKKYGLNTGLNDCTFASYATTKIQLNKKNVTFADTSTSKVETPSAQLFIDANYPNLK